jgi:uncharacterized protein YbcI
MVTLYKEQFGRGPEHVSTRFCGPDLIVSIITSSLAPVERRMVEMGMEERVRDTRTMFQHATEPQFRDAVEQITGRRVAAFMSGIDVHRDVSSEIFTLEPQSRGGDDAPAGQPAPGERGEARH